MLRIGVFVCHCGVNIGGVVNVPEVVDYAKKLSDVVYAEDNLYSCSADGINRIKEAIKKNNLNRVVVASCTPRTHEPLFRKACEESGLNRYLFYMANIREHCSWVHMHEPKKATVKAKDIVRMALSKARFLEPQEEPKVEVEPSALVIGSGISGMTAALCLANQGFSVHIIEKGSEIGGMVRRLYKLYPTNQIASDILNPIIESVRENENIKLFTSTTVKEVAGFIGNFEITALKEGQQEIKFKVGTIIVATGAIEFEPAGLYGYGKLDHVVTQLELESLLKQGIRSGLDRIVMVQCVGAREEGREYCSRLCCAIAMKNALLIKELNPKADVYILYRELQAYGKEYEEYYLRSKEQDVKFINYLQERPPEAKLDHNGSLKVRVYHTFIREEINIDCDLIILSTPLIQHKDGEELSHILKVPLGSDRFFLEAHAKLKPVEFATDGIYVCGTAHSPKSIAESIVQAYAVASRAAIPMAVGRVQSEAITAKVNEDLCRGCGRCEKICEFNAIEVKEAEPTSLMLNTRVQVNDVLCKGCGSCAVSCPTGAIDMKHFTDQQISAEIEAAFGG